MCSEAKVSRMESTGREFQPRDVRDLARFYKVSDPECQELGHLLQESRKRGWWWQDSGITDMDPLTFYDLEETASLIRFAEALVVHGLFQIEAYLKALLPGLRPPNDPRQAQVDDIVAEPMGHQKGSQVPPDRAPWTSLHTSRSLNSS